jgi:hypothetical protein
MSLPPFSLKRALFEEADWDDFLRVPTINSLPASRTVTLSTIVILLGSHQSARQTLVAEDVACVYCQFNSFASRLASSYHR